MYISVLRLTRSNIQNIAVKNQNVFDAYTLHKVVYSLFPKENEDTRSFLYVDKGGNFEERQILLLSKKEPIQPEIGILESRRVPETFLQQNYYGFEVVMNPVRCDAKTGKKIPIRGNNKEDLQNWFFEKAKSNGFEVIPQSLSIEKTSVLQFNKAAKKVTLGKATFKGQLKVVDREKFINAFENGLGKGKAFGFGLFQIVPLVKASVDA